MSSLCRMKKCQESFCDLAAKVLGCLTDGPIYEYIVAHTTWGNITIPNKKK